MWHVFKQRASAIFGFHKFSASRTPFGSTKKDSSSVKPHYQDNAKSLTCFPFADQGNHRNRRRTCDDHSKNNYQHLQYCPWLETLSWLGTAFAVGLNLKLCSNIRKSSAKNEIERLSCFCKATDLLLRLALSMPKALPTAKTNVLSLEASASKLPPFCEETRSKSYAAPSVTDTEALSAALENVTCSYFSELENLAGLELLGSDQSKSFDHFLRASDLGSTKGHFNVGICYETGQGTTVDFQKAAHYYDKASSVGHSFASYNLGLYYMEGRDNVAQEPDKGLKYMQKASELGLADAHYYLGMCYQAGWHVEHSPEVARELLTKAASLGHQDAINELAEVVLVEDEHEEPTNEVKFSIEPLLDISQADTTAERKLDLSWEKDSARTFHISTSSPELKWSEEINRSPIGHTLKSYELAVSRYLDVILPYRWIAEVSEDDELNLDSVPQVPDMPNNVVKVCIGI